MRHDELEVDGEVVRYPVLEVADLPMTDLPAIIHLANKGLAAYAKRAARAVHREAKRNMRRLGTDWTPKPLPEYVAREVERRSRDYVTRMRREA